MMKRLSLEKKKNSPDLEFVDIALNGIESHPRDSRTCSGSVSRAANTSAPMEWHFTREFAISKDLRLHGQNEHLLDPSPRTFENASLSTEPMLKLRCAAGTQVRYRRRALRASPSGKASSTASNSAFPRMVNDVAKWMHLRTKSVSSRSEKLRGWTFFEVASAFMLIDPRC